MTVEELFSLKSATIDEHIAKSVKDRWDNISKPLDGLGEWEGLLVQIMGILGQTDITRLKKATVIMCADNGVVSEGISQCGQENTFLVAALLGRGQSSASTLSGYAHSDVYTVDVGINSEQSIEGVRDCKIRSGTRDFAVERAMTEDECIRAVGVGMNIVSELKDAGYHLIATGEMGIGNTTTATALLCALTGLDPDVVTGRGSGLSDEGLERKKNVIKNSLHKYGLDKDKSSKMVGNISLHKIKQNALNALCSVGGLDIAAMMGMYLGGAVYGLPIIIDGLISAVAALCAYEIMPECRDYMIPSHSGREAGVQIVLDRLGFTAFINGNMALGEGTGAIMLMPLIDMVLDYWNTAAVFADGNITNYERIDSDDISSRNA